MNEPLNVQITFVVVRSLNRCGLAPDSHKHRVALHVAFPYLGSFTLPTAGSILETNVPSMPAADHLAGLHDPFAEGKPEVRTKVFYGVDAAVPLEQGNVQALDPYGMAKAFFRQFRQAGRTNPLVSHMSPRHPNVILGGYVVG